MRLLLDTHIVLWSLFEETRIRSHIREAIINPDNDVFVSIVTLWEIVVKNRTGKLSADLSRVIESLVDQGFELRSIETPHLHALGRLPRHHSDPFDHLLMAQAIAEDLTLVSADRFAPAYPVRLLAA